MTRRELREHCFKILFLSNFHKREEVEEQIEDYFEQLDETEVENGEEITVHRVKLGPSDRDRVRERTADIFEKLDFIDGLLAENSEGWSLGRMGTAERSILRLACYEIKCDENIPEKVAINEAVELAKVYGEKEAPAFVNGILAKLV